MYLECSLALKKYSTT